MTNMFRVLTIGMGFVASQLPAVSCLWKAVRIYNVVNVLMQAMSLYWSVSSSYGLAQNVLFKLPRVRRALAIPRTPSESKHPYKDLLAIVEQKSKAFIKLQRK